MNRHGCRFCGVELKHTFMDLGHMPPANSFLAEQQLVEPETHYPLKAMVCHECFLVQVADDVPTKHLFNERYPYFSSSSKAWVEHAKDYVDMAVERFKLGKDSLIVEIASNDGYLLQFVHSRGIQCYGIEPSTDTGAKCVEMGIPVVERFFDERLAWELTEKISPGGGSIILKKPDLIVCNNVLAHVPNLNMFVRGLKILLAEHGTITIEVPSLMKLIENSQYDTIYHEHFSYFSFTTLRKILTRHGLRVYDVEELPTHGGSMRLYVSHFTTKNSKHGQCDKMWNNEYEAGMTSLDHYIRPNNFDDLCIELMKFITDKVGSGKIVMGAGAAAKGNTFLNYCRLNTRLITGITDNTEFKQWKFCPGSHIPIYPESELDSYKPDYILILPWNHRDEIMKNLSFVREWGCKFITAIPKLEII